MHPNHEPSYRKRRLTSLRPSLVTIDPADYVDDEDALWEILPETLPLDPKIVALAETLYEEEFTED
jgi:hypothetical protein